MILNKIQNTHFSQSETEIIRYVLGRGEEIENMTVQQIANETYTSAPLLVRIAKKLGFDGWNDFKKAYLEELRYLYQNQEVDASVPFVVTDPAFAIAHNILTLKEDTVRDTRSLLKHDDLNKALSIIRKTQVIDVYTTVRFQVPAQSFMQKMFRIKRHVNVSGITAETMFMAGMSEPAHAAIVISYSGETPILLKAVKKLKDKRTPIIAITGISQSSLSRLADVSLRISSREMLNTKIADFASLESVNTLLDILYACVFSFDYDKNIDRVFKAASEMDDRYAEDEFIVEKNREG